MDNEFIYRQVCGRPINYTLFVDFYHRGQHFHVELAHFEHIMEEYSTIFLDQIIKSDFMTTFEVAEYDFFGATLDIPMVMIKATDSMKRSIDTFVEKSNHRRRKNPCPEFYCIKLKGHSIEQIIDLFPIGTLLKGLNIYIKKIEKN